MNEGCRIRVMVVDDHPTLRAGLAALIECYSDLQVVGRAADGGEALRLCAQFQPNVLLMDLLMPEPDGIEAMTAIHRSFPEVRLIAFTSTHEQHMVRAALQAGASGYLLKTMELDDLANAIRRVHAGDVVLAPEVTRILIQTVTQPAMPEGPAWVLQPREHQVLALLVAGYSNAKIAAQLQITPKTVRSHVSKIVAKLGVENRVQAVLFALEHPILSSESVPSSAPTPTSSRAGAPLRRCGPWSPCHPQTVAHPLGAADNGHDDVDLVGTGVSIGRHLQP